MALLGLDVLVLAVFLLPYARLSHLWDITHMILDKLSLVVPSDLTGMDELERYQAELEARAQWAAGKNPKKKNHKKHREQEQVRVNETKLTFVRLRVVLSKQEFAVELEQLFCTALVASAAFVVSEASYCLLNNRWFPGRQSGTGLFLVGVTFQSFFLLVSISFAMFRRSAGAESQLSIMLGLFSFMIFIGGMGVTSKTPWILPDLDLASTLARVLAHDDAVKGAALRTNAWWVASSMLAVLAALFIGCCLLPALRFSRVFKEVTGYAHERAAGGSPAPRLLSASLALAFLAPLAVVALYIDPLVAQPLQELGIVADRTQWVQLRTWLVVVLSASRVLVTPRVVQASLDSAYLVLTHMVSDPKSFTKESVESYVRNQYWLTSYVTMQHLLPALVAFPLALSRARLSGDGWGLCENCWTLLGAQRPLPSNLTEARLPAAVAGLLPLDIAEGRLSFPQPLARFLVDVFIVWSNLAFFVCTLIGFLFHARVSIPRYYAMLAAPTISRK